MGLQAKLFPHAMLLYLLYFLKSLFRLQGHFWTFWDHLFPDVLGTDKSSHAYAAVQKQSMPSAGPHLVHCWAKQSESRLPAPCPGEFKKHLQGRRTCSLWTTSASGKQPPLWDTLLAICIGRTSRGMQLLPRAHFWWVRAQGSLFHSACSSQQKDFSIQAQHSPKILKRRKRESPHFLKLSQEKHAQMILGLLKLLRALI